MTRMTKRIRGRVLSVVAVAAALAGCAYRVPEPGVAEGMPTLTTEDVRTAEITVQDDHHILDAEETRALRVEAERMLGIALAPTHGVAGAGARIVLRIVVVSGEGYAENALRTDGIAFVGLFPALFGMVIENAKVAADLRVEKDGLVFLGHDVAERDGSLFAPAEKRALGLAMRGAVESARPALASE